MGARSWCAADHYGKTALDYAEQNEHASTAKLLRATADSAEPRTPQKRTRVVGAAASSGTGTAAKATSIGPASSRRKPTPLRIRASPGPAAMVSFVSDAVDAAALAPSAAPPGAAGHDGAVSSDELDRQAEGASLLSCGANAATHNGVTLPLDKDGAEAASDCTSASSSDDDDTSDTASERNRSPTELELVFAAHDGDLAAVRGMLDGGRAGHTVHAKDDDGSTPLIAGASTCLRRQRGHLRCHLQVLPATLPAAANLQLHGEGTPTSSTTCCARERTSLQRRTSMGESTCALQTTLHRVNIFADQGAH